MQHSVLMGTQPDGLPLSETLLPQYLNKLGYRSHMVGKVKKTMAFPNWMGVKVAWEGRLSEMPLLHLLFSCRHLLYQLVIGPVVGGSPSDYQFQSSQQKNKGGMMKNERNICIFVEQIMHSMQDNVIVGTQEYGLPMNEMLLPQYLNKLGYRSRMVGKWHLGMFKWEYTPLYRGFESHFGYYQGCEDYYTHTYEANEDQWGLDFRRNKELLWNCTGQYSTTLFRDEAVKILEQHNVSEPLFLYLPFQAVHSGNGDGVHLQAPKSYIDKFAYIKNIQRRTFAAMLSALDDAVGDVYDTLRKRDMLANSIILFTTDNGGPANGYDNNAANNFPLRGVKFTLWEGGVRGVGLVHSPLLKKQGYVSKQMLHVCDWFPTLISAAGGQELLKNVTSLDGVDAWEMLSSNGQAIRSEILHNIDPTAVNAGLRVGDYKLLVGNVNMDWDGWYPPYQLSGDEQNLHYLNFTDDVTRSEPQMIQAYRQEMVREYRSNWPASVHERLLELYSYAEQSDLYTGPYARLGLGLSDESITTANENFDLQFKPERNLDRSGLKLPLMKDASLVGGTPVTLKCGPKPKNASTNCQPTKSPCLYHIPSDPCEYNNIAASNTEIVTKMLKRLAEYTKTMVPPANRPFDDKGNPRHHEGAWVPWK
ncbi:arylsulfatase j-like [Plakobranchus ocellatus]|uniref:Arylsulfatase j-like n=1 Tax=Plakobranchus ocellatus TaxID=259542 RepID=A0AAV4BN42_9GAST|nr:arylsulfatase j-like [Plakobranchus ocellatus]